MIKTQTVDADTDTDMSKFKVQSQSSVFRVNKKNCGEIHSFFYICTKENDIN